jgi:hypothetical protein
MPDGYCHLCGRYGKLSFEHVPPEAAFNGRPVRVRTGMQVVTVDPDDERGKTNQRGAGAHTLCEPCNTTTGSWYGSAYVDWAFQSLHLFDCAEQAPSVVTVQGWG